MNEPTHCPIPMQDGSDCWRAPEPHGYADICTQHMHEIARRWVGEIPLKHTRCRDCGILNPTFDRLSRLQKCWNCGTVVEFEPVDVDTRVEPEPTPAKPGPSRGAHVVYYLAFGDRVKIGTTRNLPQRVAVLPHDEILAVEPGGREVEQRRHREFAASRLGKTEWFEPSAALRAHINTLRVQHGRPMKAWRTWTTAA